MAVALSLLVAAGPAAADGDFDFYAEEAVVVTASRRPQALNESPVAIDVITAEDIAAAGPVELWDLLRFRVGLDVIEGRAADGNRAVVSVRGFPRELANSLQVLVDGRSVYSGEAGGVLWAELPVQLQDIERIEVVRGPNAVLYGSNAALGVVNILTRKPSGPLALAAAGLGGSGGLRRSAASVSGGRDAFAYRLSHAYHAQDGFPVVTGAEGRDYFSAHKANARAAWRVSEALELEGFLGGSAVREGVPGNVLVNKKPDQNFQMAKLTRRTQGGALELMGARKEIRFPATLASGAELKYGEIQYDLELNQFLGWGGGRLNSAWGGSYRETRLRSEQIYAGRGEQANEVWRGYFHQTVRPADWLQLFAGASWEKSVTGGLQPAYQGGLLLRPAARQTVRLSYSDAATLPVILHHHANFRPNPMLKLEGNSAVVPERLRSGEASWSGESSDRRLRGEAGVFYMEVSDLVATYRKSVTFPPPLITAAFINDNSAVARGFEGALRWRPRAGDELSANYTWQTVSDQAGRETVTRTTPEHKLNLGGRASLGRGFAFSANAGYKESHLAFSGSRPASIVAPSSWRLDARLAWRPTAAAELFVGGRHLGQGRHREFADGLEVPRQFYGGATVRWGD